MTQEHQYSLSSGEGFPLESHDQVIANHFERLFVLFDTFNEDSKFSLLQTEGAFRSESFKKSPSAFTAYQWAVNRLSTTNSEDGSPAALPTILCFLLRELGGFGYTEIGEMVGTGHQEVARHIAAARSYLQGGSQHTEA